jgi:hypothetical protein
MSTSFELYGKETFLEQQRKDLIAAATRNRLLHPSRLSRITIPEKREHYQVLIYRLAYVLIIALTVTLLAVQVVAAVTGSGGGGGNGIHLVR